MTSYSPLWHALVKKGFLRHVESLQSANDPPVQKGIKRPGSPIGEMHSSKWQPMDLTESGQIWITAGPGADQPPSDPNLELAKKLEQLVLKKRTNAKEKRKGAIKPKQIWIAKFESDNVKTETHYAPAKYDRKPKQNKEDPAVLKAKAETETISSLARAVLGRISELEIERFGKVQPNPQCIELNEYNRGKALATISTYQESLNCINQDLDILTLIDWKMDQQDGEEEDGEILNLKIASLEGSMAIKKLRKKHYSEYLKLRREYRLGAATEPLMNSQDFLRNTTVRLATNELYLPWKVLLRRFDSITALMLEEFRLGLLKPKDFAKLANDEISSFTARFPTNLEDWDLLLNYNLSESNPERRKKYKALKSKVIKSGFPLGVITCKASEVAPSCSFNHTHKSKPKGFQV